MLFNDKIMKYSNWWEIILIRTKLFPTSRVAFTARSIRRMSNTMLRLLWRKYSSSLVPLLFCLFLFFIFRSLYQQKKKVVKICRLRTAKLISCSSLECCRRTQRLSRSCTRTPTRRRSRWWKLSARAMFLPMHRPRLHNQSCSSARDKVCWHRSSCRALTASVHSRPRAADPTANRVDCLEVSQCEIRIGVCIVV